MPERSYCTLTSCGVAILVLTSFTTPQPAHAQFGIPGIKLNLGGFGINLGGGAGRRSKPSRHESGSGDDAGQQSGNSKSDSKNDARNDRVLASLGAPPSSVQTAVLKSVVSSGLLGVVGSTQDLSKVGQTSSKDDDRDWTGRIQRIVDIFKREQDKRITTPGDVTEHAIEQSLEQAFKSAKLDTLPIPSSNSANGSLSLIVNPLSPSGLISSNTPASA